MVVAIYSNNDSMQTCSKTESKWCFNTWKQGLEIILSLVDTLNNDIIIKYINIYLHYATSLRRAAKAHLKV